MILQLDGGSTDAIEAAKRELAALATSWGHELSDDPAALRERARSEDREERVIDPVSLTALIVSLPSVTLAVLDLADRIRKRRRAKELIDHARRLATRRISVYVMSQRMPVEVSGLDPDTLLDLLAGETPTN